MVRSFLCFLSYAFLQRADTLADVQFDIPELGYEIGLLLRPVLVFHVLQVESEDRCLILGVAL